MRVSKISFLLVIATAILASAISASAADKHFPKGMGSVTVRTTPGSYPVKIDGKYVGMSGVVEPAEFFLSPGFHTVEVAGPNGSMFNREIEIRREAKHCVCLKLVEQTISRPCPYRFHLEGPDRIQEGDLVTFAAINSGTAPVPLRYAWRVSNGRITSGLGTPTITVDSAGLGGQTINAELDVNDDTYDNKCRQVISVPTDVGKPTPTPTPEVPRAFRCDEFESKSADEDKARYDSCVIQAQNTPDAQLYVIVYPGTDRLSTTRNTYDRVSKRALDYMVKTRGFDPRRISIVKGTPRPRTTVELWIVPPGANPPPVQ